MLPILPTFYIFLSVFLPLQFRLHFMLPRLGLRTNERIPNHLSCAPGSYQNRLSFHSSLFLQYCMVS